MKLLAMFRRKKEPPWGPRTPNGLDRWFHKTHPESAAELWELVNAEVRRAWREKHLRLVK